MLDTQGNRNTLNLGDNFCSSSVTIVTRRLLSDTLYYIILSILHYTIQHTERMHCMLDTQGNRNTLNLGDNFCSSSVTIVTRRLLSVTLYYIILSILHYTIYTTLYYILLSSIQSVCIVSSSVTYPDVRYLFHIT